MAISRMKHITVGAMKRAEGELLYKLSWLSCLEVRPYGDVTVPGAEDLPVSSDPAAITRISERLDVFSKAVDICSHYNHRKKKLLAPQKYISRAEFGDESDSARLYEKAKETERLFSEISKTKADIAALENDEAAVTPFLAYKDPLGLSETASAQIILGSFDDKTLLSDVTDRLSGEVGGVFAEDLGVTSGRRYAVIYVMKKLAERCMRELSSLGFVKNVFTGDATAAESMSRIKESRAQLSQHLSELEDKAAFSAVENLDSFKAEYDKTLSALTLEQIKARIPATESCVIIEGWYPSRREKELFSLLDECRCYYEAREVTDEDSDVPVELVNAKPVAPFESIVSLYSLPDYRGIDPTFVMSIFYFIIFGLMFADVGYGLLLMIGGFLGPVLLKSKPSTKKFLNLFGICGIACTIAGVCFGGYFGDLPQKIAENWFGAEGTFGGGLLFSPLENPMAFLVVGLALGFVQVLFGMAMAGYMQIKRGHFFDAVCDVIPWYALIFGLLALAAGAFVSGLPAWMPTAGKYTALAGVVLLVLTQGRHEKGIFKKFFKGVTSLYSLVGILSDVLSYSRILALGLASAIIASVANLLATMSGLNVVGIILFVFAFLLGHLLNFALNVLGTYVHTSRLQFIEFFSRFYEDGGRAFEPVSVKTKYNCVTYKEEI